MISGLIPLIMEILIMVKMGINNGNIPWDPLINNGNIPLIMGKSHEYSHEWPRKVENPWGTSMVFVRPRSSKWPSDRSPGSQCGHLCRSHDDLRLVVEKPWKTMEIDLDCLYISGYQYIDLYHIYDSAIFKQHSSNLLRDGSRTFHHR